MERRAFLQSLAVLALASGCPLALAAESATAAFARRLRQAPWLLGFMGLAEDQQPLAMKVQGRFPAELRGTLYRNGPALMARGNERNEHWFDGDGMVQAFRLDGAKASHQGRFVRTPKFLKEQKAGRFLLPATGTYRQAEVPMGTNDDINTANINVIPFAGKLLALWEGGSATELDPDSLATLGQRTWAPGLEHMPFSAHPIRDKDGSLFNFGAAPFAGEPAVMLYHLAPDGRLRNSKLLALPFGGYMHDFAASDRYLVLLNSSCVYQGGRTYVEGFAWQGQRPSQLLLVDKHSLELVRTLEVPASFAFHFAGAEERGGELWVTLCRYRDASMMLSGMKELLATGQSQASQATLAQFRVNLASGKVDLWDSGLDMEFPGRDWRQAQHQGWVFGAGSSGQAQSLLSDALVAYDPLRQQVHRHVYGPGIVVEEPRFIAKAGAKAGQGYLLHSFLDYRRRQSGLAVLDLANLAGGPIAMAHMDRVLPLGFHGSFVAA
ncbi:carotenoid oxygenase family protein [Gallaecimonas xiamenensis]|uniref:Carotenoid oxygenase n=1 Tax=Gallaecimonas xiamenensis 3-C-1 TaxID=745411 RepID=K2IU23_9GAMM|nr:carotenoid oxygenase family protein [Gallaecimonas xiamenensis]EKE73761.1 carotenoid oxygenase [Gallaecimonas xiamenensis 3-C-1]